MGGRVKLPREWSNLWGRGAGAGVKLPRNWSNRGSIRRGSGQMRSSTRAQYRTPRSKCVGQYQTSLRKSVAHDQTPRSRCVGQYRHHIADA
eukprot:1699139-Rhodomonas_salina.1